MAVKSQKICQLALIVEDLDSVVENYVKTFNLPQPDIFYLPKSDSVPCYMDGVAGDYSDCRMAVLKFENMVFEITQPGKGDSPWKRWLEEHGPGVQHIGFFVEEKDKDEAFKSLGDLGCTMYHAGFYPDMTYTFVDGFKAFGLDFNIKWNTNNREKIADLLSHPDKPLVEV